MAQEQLRDAYELIQEGENRQAEMIVKGVLRRDDKNVDAWWLMARILEDEDEVVEALERVLTLKSNHDGARRKLASMRPEYANLASSPFDEDVKKSTSSGNTSKSGRMLAVMVMVSVLIAGVIGALAFMFIDETASIDGDVLYSETVFINSDEGETFTINERGLVTIVAEGNNGFDTVLEVYADDETDRIARNDDHNNFSGLDIFDSAIRNVRIGSGITVRVRGYAQETGRAQISVYRVNESAIQQVIDVGERRSGTIETGSAVEFILNTSERVTITVESNDSDIDPVLILFDETGRMIGYNDDNWTIDDLDRLDAGIEDIQLSGLTYIHVRDYGNNTSGSVTITVE